MNRLKLLNENKNNNLNNNQNVQNNIEDNNNPDKNNIKKLEEHFKEDAGSIIPKNDNHFLDEKNNNLNKFKYKKRNLDDIMNEVNEF
jgi:hypothetical protein